MEPGREEGRRSRRGRTRAARRGAPGRTARRDGGPGRADQRHDGRHEQRRLFGRRGPARELRPVPPAGAGARPRVTPLGHAPARGARPRAPGCARRLLTRPYRPRPPAGQFSMDDTSKIPPPAFDTAAEMPDFPSQRMSVPQSKLTVRPTPPALPRAEARARSSKQICCLCGFRCCGCGCGCCPCCCCCSLRAP